MKSEEPPYDTTIGHASPWQQVCPACGHRLIMGFVACGLRARTHDGAPITSCHCTEGGQDALH